MNFRITTLDRKRWKPKPVKVCIKLKNNIFFGSSYAAVFTEDNIGENDKSTIILANGMTMDELNKEKSETIDKAAGARQI